MHLESDSRSLVNPLRFIQLGKCSSFIYLYVGAPERALEPYEEGGRSASDIAILWHPTYAAVRKTERFKKIMRDEGLVDCWRERGWPEFCRPTRPDDFECH
jgi:hypothetical protein